MSNEEPLTLKPYWLTMSQARLHSHLRGLKYPEPLIRGALKALHDAKSKQRAKRIKQTVVYKLWDYLLSPARTELGVVRTMKSQLLAKAHALEDEAPTKFKALSAYDDLLTEVIATLRAVQKKDKLTPHQFAEQLRKRNQIVIPNRGEHWTDYVDALDRRRIEIMFDNLPDPRRGKKKVPFERRISVEENDTKRVELTKRLVAEQEAAEQEYEMATNPVEKARLKELLDRMQEAQYRLDMLSSTAPVPATWHGLLNG
jgi:hypothetical protein